MVSSTRVSHAIADWRSWITRLERERPAADLALVRRACDVACRVYDEHRRPSGELYLEHAVAVADILNGLRLDVQTLAAAVLHDAPLFPDGASLPLIEDFGAPVADLVEGVQKMSAILRLRGPQQRAEDTESLRKLLLSIEEDVRALLIKLAERTHDMRTLKHLPPEVQRTLAQETLDLYAPLANRLGMGQLKWELEDLSFRHLEPDTYQKIAALLDERRVDREQYLSALVRTLRERLAESGIAAEVTGRPKHIYSIWRKMLRKDVDFERIYDVRAVRVLVGDIGDCYTALGLAHSLWHPVPGEFDDYIARPKHNLYQSLHTAVIGPEGKVVEIQIRTHDMHQHAELGVAAHWRYKEAARSDPDFDRRIQWLRQLLELDDTADPGDFVERFKDALHYDTVHIFTPKGQVIDLPRGSTPLDFAYHVHSEVGHRCRGAKVNGRIAPLTYRLENGQQVEILTAKEGGPSRDWMNPQLGYLHTARARGKVRYWFKRQHYEEHLEQGRGILERELQRLGVPALSQETLANRLNYSRTEDLLAALGRGDVTVPHLAGAIQHLTAPRRPPTTARPARPSEAPTQIRVQGVANLVTHIAQCCNPEPGEAIVAYVTHSHGVSIHHADCPNVRHLDAETRRRLLEAQWSTSAADTWPVHIEVIAHDRPGLLRDITALVADEGINVVAVNTVTHKKSRHAEMRLALEVSNLDQVSQLLSRINHLPNVSEARRLPEGDQDH